MSDKVDHTQDGLAESLLQDLVASLDRSIAHQDRGGSTSTPTAAERVLPVAGTGLLDSFAAAPMASFTSQGDSILASLASVATPIAAFGGALGALLGLFGGGESAAPAALPKFQLPSPQNTVLSTSESTNWDLSSSDYGPGNTVRPQESQPQQVVVQVNAIDSRSFLDHRDAIASAVRQALLESHGLGDLLRGE